MAGRYKPYKKYKDSNIEWIGQVPEHWEASYLGFECSVKARLGWKGLKAEEYVDDGYVFLATPNIKDKEIDFSNVNRITKERYDESPEIMLEKGDVLVTKDGSTTGTTNIIRTLPEPATVNSSIAVLRSKGRVLSQYLYYFFVSEYTQNLISRMRGGMGVPHLFQADLRKFNILIPAETEQRFIASFLDHETAKIDILIEKQKQLIHLLKEKRQAVISHAVTKGLNPNAKMRDSGIEWLGDVPEHWIVSRLKHTIESGSSISYGIVQPGTPLDDGVPFIQTTNMSDGSFDPYNLQKTTQKIADTFPRSKLDGGEVILGIRASIGAAYVVPDFLKGANLSRGVARIIPAASILSEYLVLFFGAGAVEHYWGLSKQGSTFSEVSIETVRELWLAIPSLCEQEKICRYVNNVINKLDESIEISARQSSLLQERRTALISAAVTGKIDVRNWIDLKASKTNKEVAA